MRARAGAIFPLELLTPGKFSRNERNEPRLQQSIINCFAPFHRRGLNPLFVLSVGTKSFVIPLPFAGPKARRSAAPLIKSLSGVLRVAGGCWNSSGFLGPLSPGQLFPHSSAWEWRCILMSAEEVAQPAPRLVGGGGGGESRNGGGESLGPPSRTLKGKHSLGPFENESGSALKMQSKTETKN